MTLQELQAEQRGYSPGTAVEVVDLEEHRTRGTRRCGAGLTNLTG
jgi:hypothetical protein